MASYVSINLHYEVTQTRLTFCLPGSPPCRFVFVIAAYVNKGALLFCSALHQNLFRIRNLILPRALLALDQSAHLQISEQINTAVLRASALFTFCNLQRTSMLCSCHITGRMGERVGVKGGEEAFPHLQVVTSVQGMAERVSASGVIYLISNPFWEESLGAIPIFTERFRASQLTGQKGKDSLCVGDEWQNESWPSVGLWSVMRNKETVGLSKRKAIRPDLATVPGFQMKWWHIILFSTIYWIISKGKHVLKSETGWTFEEEDVKDNVEWRLMRLLFCHTFSVAVTRGSPTRCQARAAISGLQIWMLCNFSFCGTSCTGCARALHLATMQKLNWKGPGQSTECTHFVRHANLLGLSQNGHPRTTSCVSTQAGRSLWDVRR